MARVVDQRRCAILRVFPIDLAITAYPAVKHQLSLGRDSTGKYLLYAAQFVLVQLQIPKGDMYGNPRRHLVYILSAGPAGTGKLLPGYPADALGEFFEPHHGKYYHGTGSCESLCCCDAGKTSIADLCSIDISFTIFDPWNIS